MFTKVLYFILILKLTQARYGFVPKFYGKNNDVVEDADKSFTPIKNAVIDYRNKIGLPPPFLLWRYYPRYHIISLSPPRKILPMNTWNKVTNNVPIPTTKSTSTTSTSTTTTTTTTAKPTIERTTIAISKISSYPPVLADDEFSIELFDIAQRKLGLKSVDEIPSLSELGKLLGTESPQETLNYMKQLIANEQGVALLKAYIESSDYTDNTEYLNNKNYDEDDAMHNIEEAIKVNDDDLIVVTDEDSNDDYELNNDNREQTEDSITETSTQIIIPTIIQKLAEELPQTMPNFMGRIDNYMHSNNIFHKNEEDNQQNGIAGDSNIVSNKQKSQTTENHIETEIERHLEETGNLKNSILVRDVIPFNYPVPIRVQNPVTSTKTLTPSNSFVSSYTPAVHLSTPKMLIPHVEQLARFTNIPSKKIEDFLISKPKLLELVTKVSHFPINYDRNSPIEAQIMAAVRKVFEQDDDFLKLLNSAETLK